MIFSKTVEFWEKSWNRSIFIFKGILFNILVKEVTPPASLIFLNGSRDTSFERYSTTINSGSTKIIILWKKYIFLKTVEQYLCISLLKFQRTTTTNQLLFTVWLFRNRIPHLFRNVLLISCHIRTIDFYEHAVVYFHNFLVNLRRAEWQTDNSDNIFKK